MDDFSACFADPGGEFMPPMLMASTPSLPDFFLEDGLGDDVVLVAGDPLWQEPNTFPMLQVDIRTMNTSGGGYYFYVGRTATDAEFADSVLNRLAWFWDGVAPIWPAGKPRKWALMLRGFDVHDGNCDKYLVRHPADAWDGVSLTPTIGSPYTSHARAESKTYMSDCWAALKIALDASAFGDPARLMTDMESAGDAFGAQNDYWSAVTSSGRFTDVDEPFGPWETFSAWAALNTLDQSGTVIPLPDTGQYSYRYNPRNFNQSHRCQAAAEISLSHALEACIYGPFRGTFSPTIPCGEWQITTSTRANPVLYRPGQSDYMGSGYVGGQTMLHPAMYGTPPHWRYKDASLTTDDPRWETSLNYEAVYGPQTDEGFETDAGGSIRQVKLGRLVLATVISQLLALDIGIEVVPSLSQRYTGRTGETLEVDAVAHKAAAAPIYAACIAESYALGCPAFWLFEDKWATDAVDRASVLDYVQRANALILAQ